jgi:hypothetical protein
MSKIVLKQFERFKCRSIRHEKWYDGSYFIPNRLDGDNSPYRMVGIRYMPEHSFEDWFYLSDVNLHEWNLVNVGICECGAFKVFGENCSILEHALWCDVRKKGGI